MSIDNDLWNALYQDASKQAESYRLLAHRKELRVITLESQRRTLLAQLRQCAVDLKSRGSIEVADHFLKTVSELESAYVEQAKATVQPIRQAAGHCQPDTGSSHPAPDSPLQPSPGTAQVTYLDLPAEVRRRLWDCTSSTSGDLT